jgi:hypothetical protein
MTKYEFLDLVINAVVAIGTIGVSVLAIFGQIIRKWLYSPKLVVKTGTKAPYIEEIVSEQDSSDKNISKEIRIRVDNDGGTSAKSCIAIVEKVYQAEGTTDSFKIYKEFLPRKLIWDCDNDVTSILPKAFKYLKFATIQNRPVMTNSNSAATNIGAGNQELILMVAENKNQYVNLGIGKFIIPIKLFSDDIGKAIELYIEICWLGNNDSRNAEQHLHIRIVITPDLGE